MNEQPLPNGSSLPESPGVELAKPHFDDLAIAIAQPVEPLATTKPAHGQKLAVLRRHVSTTLLLLILCAAVGVGTVVFGLAGLHRQLNTEDAPATVLAEKPQPAETVETSKTEKEKTVSSRPVVKKTRPRATDDGKPVARKVGELTN
ncbi:MAG TPA: hypothetical protein VIU65_09820 [Pyrinomonadaceae bacterium]